MLHVHRVVHRLRKTARDRLRDPKQPIDQFWTEKRVVNEIVPNPVDVRIDHQGINEPEDQHHPQRRVRVKEEQAHKICQVKKARRGRNSIPARMRENLWIGLRALNSNHVGIHRRCLYFRGDQEIGNPSRTTRVYDSWWTSARKFA